MAEFRRERVLFHVMTQGSIVVDYEVGVETPEQAFRRVFTPANYAHSALLMLVNEADDLDWVITCATEPGSGQNGQGGQASEPTATDPSALFSGQTPPRGNEI